MGVKSASIKLSDTDKILIPLNTTQLLHSYEQLRHSYEQMRHNYNTVRTHLRHIYETVATQLRHNCDIVTNICTQLRTVTTQ